MIDHRPRVLSLDGGGVRGLSSLLILREIMEEIQRRSSAECTPLPCEYFDLIGGTSTGGLIAIMLGRLRMVLSPFMLLTDAVVGRSLYYEVY
jgi:patatin-like phospholipase/acyl hydrolase